MLLCMEHGVVIVRTSPNYQLQIQEANNTTEMIQVNRLFAHCEGRGQSLYEVITGFSSLTHLA